MTSHSTRTHHLDRRALQIASAIKAVGTPDDLFSTRNLAEWLGVSVQWLEIGRHRGYGPRFIKVTGRIIRYNRGDVLAWLEERSHRSTAEYSSVKAEG